MVSRRPSAGTVAKKRATWARPVIRVSDAVQMIALAAFVSVFCFLTLYVQNVAGFSPIRSGSAYLPVTADIVVAAGISLKLFARTGTRPASTAAPASRSPRQN